MATELLGLSQSLGIHLEQEALSELLLAPQPRIVDEILKRHGVATIGRRKQLSLVLEKLRQTSSSLSTTSAAAPRRAEPRPPPPPRSARMPPSGRFDADDSTATPTSLRYVVVHSPCVYVRSEPDTSSERVGIRWPGDELECVGERGDWLQLACGQGWVLRDGGSLGLGQLLRPCAEVCRDSGTVSLASAARPPLLVLATDGLCNRLRVALSFALVARRQNRPLVVVWPINSVCPGGFTEAFEPLDGVSFVEEAPRGVRPQFPPRSHDFHPDVRGGDDELGCYRLLQPTPGVQSRVQQNVAALGSFISLHIRRTDHWGSTATDDDFADFVDAHKSAYPCAYLATDNAVTQAKFCGHAVRGRMFAACRRIEADPSRLRQTSIADAVVDIYTCAAADGPFKGCFTSSFSDTIARLRALSGKAHALDQHTITDAHTQMGVTVHSPGGHAMHSAGSERNTYAGSVAPAMQ